MLSIAGSQAAPQQQQLFHSPYNLLNDFENLTGLLGEAVSRHAWLDAYLLAAGLGQILKDYLHPDPFLLSRAAKRLGQLKSPAGPVLSRLDRLVSSLLVRQQVHQRSTTAILTWQRRLKDYISRLARVVTGREPPGEEESQALVETGLSLLSSINAFPASLRRSVAHLPSCYRAFDQRPADLETMAARFQQAYPRLDRPVMVVGVRTSGSYLAPLAAMYLSARGYTQVSWMTVRPGRKLWETEQEMLHDLVRGSGLVLLTDDPPVTGSSLARAAAMLEKNGIPRSEIILFLQLLAGQKSLPPALQGYPAVTLPWEEWTIQRHLHPEEVRSTLQAMLGGEVEVEAAERLPMPYFQGNRGHLHALYRVVQRDRQDGRVKEKTVLVKGCGLGYFGESSLVVARALGSHLPAVYGTAEGLLYREWLPEGKRFAGIPAAEAVSSYVIDRSRSLPVAEDISQRLVGESPAWEVASNLLSKAFGQPGWMIRLPLIDPLLLRMLQPRHPSVIDGSMAPTRWFEAGPERRPVKVDFDEGVFTNDVELTCYDPVFDLASAVALADTRSPYSQEQVQQFSARLRSCYQRDSGEGIDEGKWLLYQLVRIWEWQRTSQDPLAGSRASARALERFYSALYFRDLTAPMQGALCAFDLDGVLETGLMGFPALSQSSAGALRALNLHGYRSLLATGRSLEDVRDRCEVYRLAGGAAEYGAVIYNHAARRARSLITPEEDAALDRLREMLLSETGLRVDERYEKIIRAYRLDSKGKRIRLSGSLTRRLLEAGDGLIQAAPGDSQTDFFPARINKGVGMRALIEELGGTKGNPARPLALAVGDTLYDLPLLSLAERAYAPGHAKIAGNAWVRITRRPYQRGLAQAVSDFLAHRPGECLRCPLPAPTPETATLVRILSAGEGGRSSMVGTMLRLALHVM